MMNPSWFTLLLLAAWITTCNALSLTWPPPNYSLPLTSPIRVQWKLTGNYSAGSVPGDVTIYLATSTALSSSVNVMGTMLDTTQGGTVYPPSTLQPGSYYIFLNDTNPLETNDVGGPYNFFKGQVSTPTTSTASNTTPTNSGWTSSLPTFMIPVLIFVILLASIFLSFLFLKSMIDILTSCTESRLDCVHNSPPSSKAGSYWWSPMLWPTWPSSKTNSGLWNSLCCIPYRRRQSNPNDRSSSCSARSLSTDVRNALHTGISVETLNLYSRPTTDTRSAVHIGVPVEIRSRNGSLPTDKCIRTTSRVSTIEVLLIIVGFVKRYWCCTGCK